MSFWLKFFKSLNLSMKVSIFEAETQTTQPWDVPLDIWLFLNFAEIKQNLPSILDVKSLYWHGPLQVASCLE